MEGGLALDPSRALPSPKRRVTTLHTSAELGEIPEMENLALIFLLADLLLGRQLHTSIKRIQTDRAPDTSTVLISPDP